MPPASQLASLTACLTAAALLGSCGIRLPVSTGERPEVRRVPVKIDSQPTTAAKSPDVLVWLIADSYHTGMVFPYDWLEESGFIPPENFGHPKFVTMSWGNRNAYSKEGMDNWWKIFRVIFTPTPSVMEIIPDDWSVVEVLPHQQIWRRLTPRDRGPALARFLNECSVTNADGRPIVVCESSWGEGLQLESRHPYFIPRVCNVWTAQAIECIGGDINPWFGLTAKGLVRQAEKPPNSFEKIWSGTGEQP